MSVTVLYFASLRDAAGVDSETLPRPGSLVALYDELRVRHGLPLARDRMRVAVDGAFCASCGCTTVCHSVNVLNRSEPAVTALSPMYSCVANAQSRSWSSS